MGRARPEWPTVAMLAVCYGAWAAGTAVLPALSLALAMAVTAVAVALYGSLTHEVVHGHPFPGRPRLNAALVFPALTLVIPFGRFRDTHLAHHNDAVLTDPFDDPESNYLDPEFWSLLPRPVQALLTANNTLLGRMALGPLLGTFAFLASDLVRMRDGDPRVLSAWLWHLPALVPVGAWLHLAGGMPLWAYAVSVYAALGLLRIRTFLEHQAHDRASGRTVIIEDRGPLALLFLNNNLHAVHHMHPRVPWFRLPALYRAHAAHYRRRNGGYVYRSYGEVFRRYLLCRKDPVPHPLR